LTALLLILWFGTAQQVAMAVICNPNLPASTPTADFTLDDDQGTATHYKTGLTWMRCALGQSWDRSTKTCTGSLTAYTWGEALRTAKSYSFAGYSDWRVPNVKELLTIVEDKCYNMSINETVFSSPPIWYWSSSIVAYYPDSAWFVDFFSGYVSDYFKANSLLVRLVRGGQWFGNFGSTCSMDDLTLQNVIVNGMDYQQACQTITAGPALTVGATGNLTLQAGQRITLRPGFRVQGGGRFRAVINPNL